MYTKYKIDRGTRVLLMQHIRNYEKYKKWLQYERERIMSLPPPQIDDMPRGTDIKSPTEIMTEQLNRLDISYRAIVVGAIDRAKFAFALDLEDDAREKLLDCIWLSCTDGRECPYETLEAILPYGRRQFFYRKNEFLNLILRELDK